MEDQVNIAKAMVGAYVRASRDKVDVARVIADKATSKSIRLAVKPPRVASSLRKAGVLFLLAPDPITAVPGAIMVGASYVAKRREAAGLEELVRETADTMRAVRELQSLF